MTYKHLIAKVISSIPMDYNTILYLRLGELGMLEGDIVGPKFIGECNECQSQAVRPFVASEHGSRLLVVRLATTIDGSEYGENTILIHPDNNSLVWVSKTMPYEFCEPELADRVYELLVKHLDELLAIHGPLSQGDSITSAHLSEEYGEPASIDCESVNEEFLEMADHVFHLRFSCGDMFLAADGDMQSPSKCLFLDKDDNSDFSDSAYFEEICSDLEFEPSI